MNNKERAVIEAARDLLILCRYIGWRSTQVHRLADTLAALDAAKPEAEAVPDKWPVSGPADNGWYQDAAAFCALIQQHPGFWCTDHTVKYLNIRVDTRDGAFVFLPDERGLEPDAERVLTAINRWNSPAWRGTGKEPAR